MAPPHRLHCDPSERHVHLLTHTLLFPANGLQVATGRLQIRMPKPQLYCPDVHASQQVHARERVSELVQVEFDVVPSMAKGMPPLPLPSDATCVNPPATPPGNLQSTDPRFGAVTQFSTGANSHYNGLQLTAMKRMGHGLEGQVNYTWSRCMDTVSNGGFLSFSAGGILSPLPGDLARDYGPCDYDIRHNLNTQYVYQLPLKVRSHWLGFALNGWQVSGTAFLHSGVPFSVLSTPYSANGNGTVQGSGPQFASAVPGVPRYEHHLIPGVTQGRTIQWLNPDAFVSAVDPSTGQCHGGDSPQNCQFGNLGRNALRGPGFLWSDFYLTKWFPLSEHVKLRFEGQFFNVFNHQCFQSSKFWPAKHGTGRHSGKSFHAERIWRSHLHHLSADRLARGRAGWR